MKNPVKYLPLLLAGMLAIGCDPIEDESLREKHFENPGTPITKEDLFKALEVTQPFENRDGVVEGDQYIVITNHRPDIGGAWTFETATGSKTSRSDHDTIIYTDNGTFNIYYTGISAGQIVKTDPIQVTVTNVFDTYETILNGAANKSDLAAKKVWELTGNKEGHVCYMGAHGAWKYEVDIWAAGIKWWANQPESAVSGETMEFAFDKHLFTTYNADGSINKQGNYAFTHTEAEPKVLGELITTVPILGGRYDEVGEVTGGKNNTFWIIQIDETHLVIYHPAKYAGGEDWSDYGWWAFYKAKD